MPVWIDVRTTPLPDVSGLNRTLEGTTLDVERRVVNDFSRKFFVRNLLLAADGTLLNPCDRAGWSAWWRDGHFPYAQVAVHSYAAMLDAGLAAHERWLLTRRAKPLARR